MNASSKLGPCLADISGWSRENTITFNREKAELVIYKASSELKVNDRALCVLQPAKDFGLRFYQSLSVE